MQQAVRRRLEIIRDVAPPIVDEHIEILERLDVVPPQGRDIDGIAGRKFCKFGGGGRLGEAWKAIEVRIANVDQADWLASRGLVQRTDVEILDLIGRKHRESTPSTDHAGQVFCVVEMRGN